MVSIPSWMTRLSVLFPFAMLFLTTLSSLNRSYDNRYWNKIKRSLNLTSKCDDGLICHDAHEFELKMSQLPKQYLLLEQVQGNPKNFYCNVVFIGKIVLFNRKAPVAQNAMLMKATQEYAFPNKMLNAIILSARRVFRNKLHSFS